MGKPKVAICWLGGCGGCDEAIVDLNAAVLWVASAVDFVLWPVAIDFKYRDLRGLGDGEVALSLVNGHVRNSEQEEVAELLRKKSQLLIAFGSCACFGGTPGLANLTTKEDIFDWVYNRAPTVVNPQGNRPQTKTSVKGLELTLPDFYARVYPLNEIVDVDYYLPGCPPPPELIESAIRAVLDGKLPPRGSHLAPHKALCDSCKRNKGKPDRLALKEFVRLHEVEANPDTCFLAQGIICMGPATRSGCGETCLNINVPCLGCSGPVEGVADSGAKFISGLASILDAQSEREARALADQVVDPAGYFYRFTLPASALRQVVRPRTPKRGAN